MAKLESLRHVAIYTKDQKKAREFYVRKVGLKVREANPKTGYAAFGATKGGEDASLVVVQPMREVYGAGFEAVMGQIGGITGVGFSTTNLDKTVEALKRKGVPTEGPGEEGEGRMARFTDPDGNVLFTFEPPRPKVRRVGLQTLDFITIVSRDAAKAGEFFRGVLGMKEKVVPGEGFREYRLGSRGTALMPFTPTREMYEDPKDYDEDMAHVGEDTSITFTARDIYKVQDDLMARGVRFKRKAEQTAWGGVTAEFFDADDNVYALVQPRA